jgi:mRNA interferase HigB
LKNIVSRKKIRDFWIDHKESEEALKTWYKVAMQSNWQNSNEIKAQYKNASVIKHGRVIFNICGNKYRLIVKFNFEMQWAWVRFIGTHSEYDKINALTI